MCRLIVGIFKLPPNTETFQSRFVEARDQMMLGGPDDSGLEVISDGKLWFGFRRLAIVDVSHNGHQPMWDLSGNICIVFNGEIYNFLDLKNELIGMGISFDSQSDTEVILNGYLHWGEAVFSKLSGMFAIVLYDLRSNQVYVARDPSGIKPLYMYQDQNQVFFSSELRVLPYVISDLEESKDWPVYFLAFGYIPEPFTLYANVTMFPAGGVIQVDTDTLQIKKIADLSYEWGEAFSKNTYLQDQAFLRREFASSLNRHFISDVPLGVFLSGGIDSSLLVLLGSELLLNQLITLSVLTSDPQYNEACYQHKVAELAQSEHHECLIEGDAFFQLLPQIFKAYDQPTVDGINTFIVSKKASDVGLKVVLSGLGGDELFGGYRYFDHYIYAKLLLYLPNAILKGISKISNKKFSKFDFLTLKGPLGKYLFFRGLFSIRKISKLLGYSSEEVCKILSKIDSPLPKGLSSKNEWSYLEYHFYMRNQLLRDSDVMGMANGLEIRVPFLDSSLLKQVLSLSPIIKFRHNKAFVTDAFSDLLPREIYNRRKMGFGLPFQKWFKEKHQDFSPYLRDLGPEAQVLYKEFLRGALHWSKFWALVVTGYFKQERVGKGR